MLALLLFTFISLSPMIGLLMGLRLFVDEAQSLQAGILAPDRAEIIERLEAADYPPGWFREVFLPTLTEGFGDLQQNIILCIVALVLVFGLIQWIWPLQARNQGRFADYILKAGLGGVLVVTVFIGFFPVSIAGFLYGLTIISIFLCSLLACLLGLQVVSRRCEFPFTPVLVVAAIIFSSLGHNQTYQARLLTKSADSSPLPSLEDSFVAWLDARRAVEAAPRFDGGRFPVFIISAQGGGIFAAKQSATFLANLYDRLPYSRDHVFAVSGVSGGSVGAAIFVSALDFEQCFEGRALSVRAAGAEPAAGSHEECAVLIGGTVLPDEGVEVEIMPYVDEALSRDLLSPVLGSFAFPDFAQRFLPARVPGVSRAVSLELAIEEAFKDAVDYTIGVKVAQTPLLEQSYLSHWTPMGEAPALLLNTTEIGSGDLHIFAPFTFGDPERGVRSFKSETTRSVRLSTAAVLSARAPWVTPAAWVEGYKDYERFADGGYLEHTGVATALVLYEDLLDIVEKRPELADAIELHLIILTSEEVSGPRGRLASRWMPELGDPLRGLLSTWISRGNLTVRDAQRFIAASQRPAVGEGTPMIVSLKEIGYSFPLGWRMSELTRTFIRVQAGDPSFCKNGESIFDADCVLMRIDKLVQQKE